MAQKEEIKKIVREEILKQKLEGSKGAIKSWYYHLIIYLVVNIVSSVYVLISGGFFWPVFPIIFWGAGILAHLIGVLGERKSVQKQLKALKK